MDELRFSDPRDPAEIKKAERGTPCTLDIPGFTGEIGELILLEINDDPQFPGLSRKWSGVVTSTTESSVTITGRYWVEGVEPSESAAGGIQ